MHSWLSLADTATGISCHSSEVRPGYIFVAIAGRATDGNRFAAQAAARGAKAVVTDLPHNLPPLAIPVVTVPNARQALAALAARFYRNPSHELSLVGVTGSNGKTTIAAMLEAIYRQAGYRAGMIGTVRVNVGGVSYPSVLTTPDAAHLQHYLREMRNNGVTHAAMEISAQGMEMHRTDHVRFTCGILTNICPDHLDFHGTYESYIAAKQLFIPTLAGAPLIVNAADPACMAIAARHLGKLITVGMQTTANISAVVKDSTPSGSVFSLLLPQPLTAWNGSTLSTQPITLRLGIPGIHNVENALFAAAAALWQDIPADSIAAGLECFGGVERRLTIRRHQGLTIVDDTALNPGSIHAVFQTVRQFPYKRLIVVNAIRGRRGPGINAANAQTLVSQQQIMPYSLIVTASQDHTGPADKVTFQEQEAFLSQLDQAKTVYEYQPCLRTAIQAALRLSGPGDLLLLLGAQGMDDGYGILAAQLQPVEIPVYIRPVPAMLPH